MQVLIIIFCVASCWAFPRFDEVAEVCIPTECNITNDCRCCSTDNPVSDADDPAPQLIAITLSQFLTQEVYDIIKPLFFDRSNPDGKPRGFTFYVSHEHTNYTLVQDLYLRGFEIGDNSITRDAGQAYWKLATLQDLREEFGGQRTIISTFANIPKEDIVGVRTPQLQLGGDTSIQAYIDSGLTYDNSWPTTTTNRVLPYTLDYASTQQCVTPIRCPEESHPHFWIAPISSIIGADGRECNSLATCDVRGTADDIAAWLIEQVDIVRKGNRAPLILRVHVYWFEFIDNSFEGFSKFLEQASELKDVFFVSVQDVLAWIHNPVPLSQYTTPLHDDRHAGCLPINCQYLNEYGDERWMGSCVPCPPNYPWKGNPLGE
ncbi:hypothetical protein BDFB_007493 [Asbolus verrucosus]|uniref:Chitin deacetylase n=1 Tax=Asbolus verrucosus TaxID=1661398 RepID=A0A482V784_ASBVE|nr:hypothetical protein BDFB_007493 [Asbolus verrucosus]